MSCSASPTIALAPPSSGIRSSDPVASCSCGGALYAEPCRHHGAIYRFHCYDCGYCHSHARSVFTFGSVPVRHRMKGMAIGVALALPERGVA